MILRTKPNWWCQSAEGAENQARMFLLRDRGKVHKELAFGYGQGSELVVASGLCISLPTPG